VHLFLLQDVLLLSRPIRYLGFTPSGLPDFQLIHHVRLVDVSFRQLEEKVLFFSEDLASQLAFADEAEAQFWDKLVHDTQLEAKRSVALLNSNLEDAAREQEFLLGRTAQQADELCDFEDPSPNARRKSRIGSGSPPVSPATKHHLRASRSSADDEHEGERPKQTIGDWEVHHDKASVTVTVKKKEVKGEDIGLGLIKLQRRVVEKEWVKQSKGVETLAAGKYAHLGKGPLYRNSGGDLVPEAMLIERAKEQLRTIPGCIAFAVNLTEGVEFYSGLCFDSGGELEERAAWKTYVYKPVG